MTKIYAVWKGEYSDRDIVFVTLDENLAKEYLDNVKDIDSYEYDNARIVVYEDAKEVPRLMFECEFKYDTLELLDCYHSDFSEKEVIFYYPGRAFIDIYVLAKNKELAIKIASERVVQYKYDLEHKHV